LPGQPLFYSLALTLQSPNILSPLSLSVYYANLTLTSHYFKNYRHLSSASAARMWARLPQPTDPHRWNMPAAVVNANYDPTHNDLTFPAGILQPPYFRAGVPAYVNYASFGVVAGHELSHAFDNHGRKYDARGRLEDWWDAKTAAEFDRRAQCYVVQYSGFKSEVDGGEMAVDGAATLGENLADSLGLQAAYEAWKSLKFKQAESKLPGMETWSVEQAFFLAYANVWCSKYTPAELRRRIRTDVHSPNMARVMGPVMNSRGFREAFGCEKTPSCEMW
jgi:endothelin-converting enzyme